MFTFGFFVRLLTIVQLGKTSGRVDSGTNFEQTSLQNMQNRLKLEQNMWTRLIFRLKHVDLIKFSIFYPHKPTSVFLLPLFVFHPKFEFSLEFIQRCLVKKSTHFCQRSPSVVIPTSQPLLTAILYIIKIKLYAVLLNV